MKFETSQTPYNYIWHKYRPAILRMMVNSETAPQQYAFSDHEFRRVFPKKRVSLAFILFVNRSKALNNIKSSLLAQALLTILRDSKTAATLSEESTYEFILDEKFVFHVRKNQPLNASELSDTSSVTSVTL